MGRLAGKTALVTAAGQGIGAATVRAFASEGADVLATDIDAASLERLSAQVPGIRTSVMDVTDATAIATAVSQFGPFTVLLNGAGMVPHGSLLECTIDVWSQTFEMNVTSMFNVTRAVLPGMLEAGVGSIINMSSMTSSVATSPRRCAYGTSKAAVIGLTKSIAADYVGDGVRCNVICPGAVDTPALSQRMEGEGDQEAARQRTTARIPLGRMGRPDEVAALATFLASDESGFSTGSVHILDGGRTL